MGKSIKRFLQIYFKHQPILQYPMDYSPKENTKRDSKTHKNCPLCCSSYVCKKCKGVCILNPDFLKLASKTKNLSNTADPKYYPTEFEAIKKATQLEDQYLDLVEALERAKNNKKLKTLKAPDTLDYLEAFHKLEKDQKNKIIKLHTDGH